MAFNKDKLLKSAEKQVSKGRIEAAIKDYTKILAKAGEDPNILNRIGDLYKRLRKNPDAIRYWEKTAECYEKSGFYVKAIAVQKKIQRLEPSSLQVHRRLAELYHRQGLINDARSHYQHLVDHYMRQEEAASAIGIYQKLIELEPEDPGHRARLAELYRQQQLPTKAVAEYGQIAQLFITHGEFDQARMIYVRALEVDSSDPEFVRRGVVALREAGRSDLAQEFLDAARPLNDEVASFQSLLGAAPAGEAAPAAEPPAAEDAAQTLAAPPEPSEGAVDGFALVDTGESAEDLELEVADLSDSGASDFTTAPPAGPEVDTLAPQPAEADSVPSALEEAQQGDGGAVAASPEEMGFEDFDIDFDDEAPASQVQPPADMADTDSGLAFARDETGQFQEIELDLDSELGAPTVAATEAEGAKTEDGYEIEGVTFAEAPGGPPTRAPSEEPAAAIDEIAFEIEEVDLPSLDASDLGSPELDLPEQPVPSLEIAAETAPTQAPEAPPSEAPPPFSLGEDWEMEEEPVGDVEPTVEEPPVEEPAAAAPAEESFELDDVLADIGPDEAWAQSPEPASEPSPLGVAGLPHGELSAPDLEIPTESAGREIPSIAAEAPPLFPTEPAETTPPPQTVSPPPEIGLPPVEVPETVQRVNDLLAEAEVFVKYGLQEKAVDRLEEVLTLDPKHLGAATQLVRLQLERREHAKVAPLVNQLYLDVEETGAMELWGEIKQQLLDQGYGFEGETVTSLPGQSPTESGEVAVAAGAAAGPGDGLVDLHAIGAEIDRELGEDADAEVSAAGPVSEGQIAWLDSEPPKEEQGQELFEEEEALFDLAAELQSELAQSASEIPVAPEEQSLEQIIDGFKKGVSENLSPEDSDTHYNLGIAYREMMLLDEAIGEFQIAAKDPAYLVDSCAMLGLCFRDKGLPDLALKWYKKGLEASEIDESRALGMLYDVADIYLETQDPTSAYNTFVEIYGINTNYRDVASRMQELAPS